MMDANKIITALFTLKKCTLVLAANPPSGGTVTGAGVYDFGTNVTITASPNNISGSKYRFINWTEFATEVSKNPAYLFKIATDRNLIANFEDLTSIHDVGGLPIKFALNQNYPNPFNPSTVIQFSIAKEVFVTLSVFSTLGEQVAELVNQHLSPSTYSVNFDAKDLPNGIYFYKIQAGEFVKTKKMILMK